MTIEVGTLHTLIKIYTTWLLHVNRINRESNDKEHGNSPNAKCPKHIPLSCKPFFHYQQVFNMSSIPTFKKPLTLPSEDPGEKSASNVDIGRAYDLQPVQSKVDNDKRNNSNKEQKKWIASKTHEKCRRFRRWVLPSQHTIDILTM